MNFRVLSLCKTLSSQSRSSCRKKNISDKVHMHAFEGKNSPGTLLSHLIHERVCTYIYAGDMTVNQGYSTMLSTTVFSRSDAVAINYFIIQFLWLVFKGGD